jgi:hypothetical protein
MNHQELNQKLQAIIDSEDAGKLGSVISDLQEFPALYAIAYWVDRGGAVLIFQDPDHTISYNIAIRAKEGDEWAIEACKALNALSPSHCEWALSNEALCRITA